MSLFCRWLISPERGLMKVALVVDGYNLIHSSPLLKKLLEKSLYLAQERLVHLVADFCSVEGIEGWVVFDAYRRSSLDTVEEVAPAVKMVLTGKGKTADSYIERFVLQKKSYYDYIYVVTQDFAQAMTVLDSKILPLSPKDFFKQIEISEQRLREKSCPSPFKFSPRMADYIKEELMHKLRKQKKQPSSSSHSSF